MLKNDLENIKRYLTGQIQEMVLALKEDESKPPEKRFDEKARTELNANLLQQKKEREIIKQKIKRYRLDSLLIQSKKSLEELTGPGNIVDKLISDAKKKPISLSALPVRKKKKPKRS